MRVDLMLSDVIFIVSTCFMHVNVSSFDHLIDRYKSAFHLSYTNKIKVFKNYLCVCVEITELDVETRSKNFLNLRSRKNIN